MKKCSVVSIDLKKSFDTIDHNILLKKLDHYGIRGITLDLFKSYISNRFQCIEFDGVLSDLKKLNCGVPQGSVLGPILFILYINDLPNISKLFKPVLYTDDTNIIFSSDTISDLSDLMNSELKKLSSWIVINKLTLNIDKCIYILFNVRNIHSSNTLPIFQNEIPIKHVLNYKFLGVYIDEKLDWKQQY